MTPARKAAARKARAQANHLQLSERQLAEMSGMSQRQIGPFFRGQSWPNPRNRYRLSRALGWAETGIDDIADSYEEGRADGRHDLETSVLNSDMSENEKKEVILRLMEHRIREELRGAQNDEAREAR